MTDDLLDILLTFSLFWFFLGSLYHVAAKPFVIKWAKTQLLTLRDRLRHHEFEARKVDPRSVLLLEHSINYWLNSTFSRKLTEILYPRFLDFTQADKEIHEAASKELEWFEKHADDCLKALEEEYLSVIVRVAAFNSPYYALYIFIKSSINKFFMTPPDGEFNKTKRNLHRQALHC